MVEGLKVTVSGVELRDLLKGKYEYSLKRTEFYKKMREQYKEDVEIPSASASHATAFKDKITLHEANSRQFKFLSEHVDLTKTYELSIYDLQTVGAFEPYQASYVSGEIPF